MKLHPVKLYGWVCLACARKWCQTFGQSHLCPFCGGVGRLTGPS